VRSVFEDLGTGSEEDERVRVLAAGVVVRCQEVIEKYQRRMAGALMDY
jgi:telomere length regulation protein